MKKIFYLLLLASSFSFSQSGFIEVEVRDTIKLSPTKILFNITIDQSSVYRAEVAKEYDPIKAKEMTNSKLLEIEKFLNDNNYTFHKIGESNFQIRNSLSSWNNGFTVTMKTINKLEKLVKDLRMFNFIDASVTKVEHKENDDFNKRLFEKLVSKAKDKANTIAQLTNLKVGSIIEVKEVKEIDNLNFSIMDLMLTNNGANSLHNSKNIYSTKSKAIIVKFKTE